jgi:hypothetical protein
MKTIQIIFQFLLLSMFLLCPALLCGKDTCGEDPGAHRTLTLGWEAYDHFESDIHLLGIQRNRAVTRITVSIKNRIYSSSNRGTTWRSEASEPGCGQFTTIRQINDKCIISNADPQTLYRMTIATPHNSDVEVSRDGGRSWKLVHPKTIKGRHLGKVRILGTGYRSAGRVYADVPDIGEFGLYVSEDFGEIFKQLSWGGLHLVESRTDPNTLYLIMPSDGIMVSNDRGAKWRPLTSSEIILSPLYIPKSAKPVPFPELRSWRTKDDDKEYPIDIEQVETDPADPEIIYALSTKGLFRSTDAGKTFVLLPLAKDRVESIQMISADPVDGGYLYAVVGGKQLFKSSDYGCSWNEIALPASKASVPAQTIPPQAKTIMENHSIGPLNLTFITERLLEIDKAWMCACNDYADIKNNKKMEWQIKSDAGIFAQFPIADKNILSVEVILPTQGLAGVRHINDFTVLAKTKDGKEFKGQSFNVNKLCVLLPSTLSQDLKSLSPPNNDYDLKLLFNIKSPKVDKFKEYFLDLVKGEKDPEKLKNYRFISATSSPRLFVDSPSPYLTVGKNWTLLEIPLIQIKRIEFK